MEGDRVKYSKQRNVILDIVKRCEEHPTADMIYSMAIKEMPSIGIATVYRNLNALAENGDIVKISGGAGVDRYDGRLEEHYHLKCPKCGKIIDIFPRNGKLLKEAKLKTAEAFGLEGFDIEFNDTLFECLCTECKSNKQN